ncbi:ROK family protein [Youxingia wuxianensis]|uniref:Glucokinase n=1 Tax=Youxingia wuxianensis TaxID=2763678 RepID=A0A926EPV8_9FIRM|nr:ROK family protein [Youxingia wuxianensis]MBC8584169.1 ROK family protein [Youxingia wuxianensis]
MGYYIGIDLGGTNVAVGVVNENYQIIGKANRPTKAFHPAQEIADDMAQTAQEAVKDAGIEMDQVDWIGVGTPGTVNPQTGIVGLAANLGFENTPLKQLVYKRMNKPVYLENDANAAAYGEMMAGAAKGMSSVVVITLGTGVGGGIIIDGKIYSGFNYKGAELGHMSMVYHGVPCTCGRKGCIEAYCSVTALIRITREAMQLNARSKMWQVANGSLDAVNGRTSFDAMRLGDETAKRVVEQYIDYLAFAVSGLINGFQPQALVIGGGISKEGETLFAPLREKAYPQTFNHDPDNCTAIVRAQLGNDAGIIGAALLGKQY